MSKNDASGTCYLYLLETMADWEVAYLTAELHSGRFTAAGRSFTLSRIGADLESVVSMGGMQLTPEKSIEDVDFSEGDLLILPGADTWSDARHGKVMEMVPKLLDSGVIVAAICGATVALAQAGLLDDREHTSNDKEFLKMMCPAYRGEARYIDAPVAVSDGLITASGLAPLEFTREVFKQTEAMGPDVLEAWYQLYRTRESNYFFALMEAVERDRTAREIPA